MPYKITKGVLIGKLKLLGHEYDVKLYPDLKNDEDAEGLFDNETSIILLEDSLNQSNLQETLLHEIVEGINHHLELKLQHSQISSLTSTLTQIFRDNTPFLKKYLFKTTPEKRKPSHLYKKTKVKDSLKRN